MPRTIFLSFLGTNAYIPCNYYQEDKPAQRVEGVSYIQEALLRMYGPHLSAKDACYFFLTDKARKVNWLNNGLFNRQTKKYNAANIGLRQRLLELRKAGVCPAKLKPIRIPEGFAASEIWEIFQIIFAQIQPGDRLIIDITHAFRFLPMLGTVLVSYAKALKGVEVEAIHYGAFEKLGPAVVVSKMPLEERNAPILNLTSLAELQDWTTAAHDFVQYGKPERWNTLANRSLQPILRDTQGQDKEAAQLKRIGSLMQCFTQLIATNRGGHLMQFDFNKLKETLSLPAAGGHQYVHALAGILEQVRLKMSPFVKGDALLWLDCVQWCINHDLIPQGISQLQEGLLTFLCNYYDKRGMEPDFFRWQKRDARNFLSSLLNVMHQKKKAKDWQGSVAKHKALALKMTADPLAKQLASPFAKLTEIRNDIMHSGYTKQHAAKVFYAELDKLYRQIRTIVEAHTNDVQAPPAGLLNLSNHPVAGWSAPQRNAAQTDYETIKDLAFPHIDPAMQRAELDKLVDQYYEKVIAINPAAVHLMGEMTFTHALVQRLKAAGIPCLASTSERLVEEREGKKVVTFHFVQFRPY